MNNLGASLEEREQLAALINDVGIALTRRGSLQRILQSCCEALVENLHAAFARVWSLNPMTDELELKASAGLYTHLDGPHARVPVGRFKIGLIAAERLPHLTNAVLEDPRVGDPEWARREGMVSFAGYPLIVEDELVGVVAMFARAPLSLAVLQAMEAVSHGLALAIQQKRDEEALRGERESAQQIYRELAEAMPQQVWTANTAGELDYVNQRVLTYFNELPEKILGAAWLEFVHPDDREGAVQRWVRSLETGCPYEVEFRLLSVTDSEYRWHLGRAVPMRDKDGAIVRWLGTNTDIHDRRQGEEALREAKLAAESANQAKSQFLASMSHELRTPLNAVIGYSEMLQDEAVERQLTEFIPDLQKIHRAGGYLLNLINNVLDLSKIEAGKIEIFLEEFSIFEMIQDVVNTARPLVERGANILMVDCPEDVGNLRSDVTKIRQCLLNLLSNAAKFTVRGTIRLQVSRSSDRIVFGVNDSGVGLSPDQVANLFQPFRQFHLESNLAHEGSGLGLAITHRLCQLLDGNITVKSDLSKGSTFTITVPSHPFQIAAAPVHVAAADRPAVRRNTVLLVDDDVQALDIMVRFLRKEGYDLVTASSGPEALRLARELRPNVITLDVMLPGLDGWSVLGALKADPELADIPVIMVTIIDNRNLGYALGATEYLTKPLDRRRLVTILSRYCTSESSKRVLVVDDDAANRDLMSRTLSAEGWSVEEAEDGEAALERMRNAEPCLIVLDLLMPKMDGFDFAMAIRQSKEWRSIPIVVITSKDLTQEDRDRLNGKVQAILQRGAYTRDEFLREIRDLADSACKRIVS